VWKAALEAAADVRIPSAWTPKPIDEPGLGIWVSQPASDRGEIDFGDEALVVVTVAPRAARVRGRGVQRANAVGSVILPADEPIQALENAVHVALALAGNEFLPDIVRRPPNELLSRLRQVEGLHEPGVQGRRAERGQRLARLFEVTAREHEIRTAIVWQISLRHLGEKIVAVGKNRRPPFRREAGAADDRALDMSFEHRVAAREAGEACVPPLHRLVNATLAHVDLAERRLNPHLDLAMHAEANPIGKPLETQ